MPTNDVSDLIHSLRVKRLQSDVADGVLFQPAASERGPARAPQMRWTPPPAAPAPRQEMPARQALPARQGLARAATVRVRPSAPARDRVWPWIIATISQFAINDGNYYESINAGQNLIGGVARWRRVYTCLIVAAGGALVAYLVNYRFVNGWFDVATFLAITVPCATTIMAPSAMNNVTAPMRLR